MEATYWSHRLKHLACGLHFVVLSDFENWPKEGTTADQQMKPISGFIHCPECGGTGAFLHWKQQVQGFIFEAVPGGAQDMVLA